MWAIYYPFSTSEVISIYKNFGLEIDPLLVTQELKCSIYNDARSDYLDGYHNLSDILDFHYRAGSEFFPVLNREGLDELLDCIFILIESYESDPMFPIRMATEKQYPFSFSENLFDFVALEKPGRLQIEGVRGFSPCHAAELTLIYVLFLRSYYETQSPQHQTVPVEFLENLYLTNHYLSSARINSGRADPH